MRDHLIVKRLDLKLFQKDMAKIIGVSAESINHWDTKITEPEVQYYPKIMEFLGYCPIHYSKSFGELLFLHRTHRGLSHRKLGKVLGVDQATISRWENDDRMPYRRHRGRLRGVLVWNLPEQLLHMGKV